MDKMKELEKLVELHTYKPRGSDEIQVIYVEQLYYKLKILMREDYNGSV